MSYCRSTLIALQCSATCGPDGCPGTSNEQASGCLSSHACPTRRLASATPLGTSVTKAFQKVTNQCSKDLLLQAPAPDHLVGTVTSLPVAQPWSQAALHRVPFPVKVPGRSLVFRLTGPTDRAGTSHHGATAAAQWRCWLWLHWSLEGPACSSLTGHAALLQASRSTETSASPAMVRPAVTLAAALVCCIGGALAVGNGPYLGGLTFVSSCRLSMAGSFVLAC